MKTFKANGFSLVEAIIVIALVAVILSIISSTLVVVVKSFGVINRTRTLVSGASSALERLAREARQAKNINAGSVLGVNPSTVIFDTTVGGSNTTVTFSLVSGTLMLQQAGVTASLTPKYLNVNNFTVRQINTPVSKAVKIDLSANDTRGEWLGILLYDTIILRGSY